MPTWRLVESDCRSLRVTVHQRQFEGAHRGRGCETIQLTAGQGTYIYLAHAVPPARIIRELSPSVWVKSDRHGLQLMARVVFPRTLENGRPITSFLFGDRYEATDVWRQLRIDDLELKLQREVVALRTQKGPGLDGREAYIDMLVLNAYTGPGPVRIWTDDLELPSFVAAAVQPDTGGPWPQSVPAPREPDPGSTGGSSDPSGASLQGNVLVVAGRPVFVRAVEHRGETLSFLQSLGFNAAVLSHTPTSSQLDEAGRCGIWLIAPPGGAPPLPAVPGGADPVRPNAAGSPQGPLLAFDPRVIAFHLGNQFLARDWPVVEERMRQIAETEPQVRRPFVAHVRDGRSRWRHDSLILLLEHPAAHTSFELQDYVLWLSAARRDHRSSAPCWAVVPTEGSAALQQQVQHLAGGRPVPFGLEPDQMRWLAFAGVAAGARGLWFQSRTRLDEPDPVSRQRAATLRQVNRELELVAPWVAGGSAMGEQETGHARIRVFAWQTERARLLILLRRQADQQFVTAPVDSQQVAFTLQSPPATDRAYLVSASGVETLPSLRTAGLQLTLDQPDVVSLVLLTSDPLAVNFAGRTAAAIRGEVAAAWRDSTALLLEETESVERALQSRGLTSTKTAQLLVEAQSQMRRAEDLRSQGDALHSTRASKAATNALRRARRDRWEQTVLGFTSPAASPLCAAYSLLPAHYQLADQLAVRTWSNDLLAGGGMEHLDHLLSSGWKQRRADVPGVTADVQLSLESPREGRTALYLRAWSTDPGSETLDGQPPVTVTTAPIAVRAGQLLRVRGWARVPRPLAGTWDGLLIHDSHSGPELAERITETQGWREFTLYRAATSAGDWQLVFALTGLGEAWIDAVSIATLGETVPVSLP